MEFEAILYDTADGVATITLNRPDALNAITVPMLHELRTALKDASKSDEVSAIIITGAGRAFSAGLDLIDLQERKSDAGDVGDIVNKPARKLIKAIRKSPKPVIARVNGFCFTGALEIALACDLFWVADDAKLGDTHAKWGLRPTWGMSARLPHAVGMRKAKELSFTADTFTGIQAAEWGMANRSVPLEELDASIKELTDKLIENSSGSLEAYKILYNRGGIQSQADALKYEDDFEFEIADSADRLAEFSKK
jgi:enoyl-CoA hydratase